MVLSWFLCFDDGFGGGPRSRFVSNPVSGKTGIHKTSAEGRSTSLRAIVAMPKLTPRKTRDKIKSHLLKG
jgi:hypothetical protein